MGQLPLRENSLSCKKTLFGIFPGATVEDHGKRKQGTKVVIVALILLFQADYI